MFDTFAVFRSPQTAKAGLDGIVLSGLEWGFKIVIRTARLEPLTPKVVKAASHPTLLEAMKKWNVQALRNGTKIILINLRKKVSGNLELAPTQTP